MQAPLALTLLFSSQVDTSTLTYAVDVHDARLAEPIDPHARREMTGRELAEVGATNLAEALEHIPAAFVRTAGRGGVQIDLRGARKGGVLILIDGIPVSDPFFGNFDIASIPTTDIAEIRVSKSPASPVDGPGGHGGVVEVITRSAVGKRRGWARMQAGTAPGGRASLTAKGDLAEGFAARASAGGSVDARNFTHAPADLDPITISQSGRSGQGALLVEWIGDDTRIGADLWVGNQSYVVPPSQLEGADLTLVDDELTLRASVSGELTRGDLRLSMTGFAHTLTRDTLRFASGHRVGDGALEHVEAGRYGGLLRGDLRASDDLMFHGSATFAFDDGRQRDRSGVSAGGGNLSLLQAGVSARWTPFAWLDIDAAGGAAIPFLDGASPWPEARLSAALDLDVVTLTFTGARKGRAPTLRERYQPGSGNPALGAELSWYGEGELIIRPLGFLSITGTGWARANEGLIKFPSGGTQLANTGDLLTAGVDAQLDLAFLDRRIEGGVVFMFQTQQGDSPLDFFPASRAEAWIQARTSRDLGVWVRGKYLGSRVDQNLDLGKVVTFDAGLFAKFDVVRATVRIENAFDTEYQAHANIPAFGRTFWLGIEAETP